VLSFSPLIVQDIGFNSELPLAIWVIPGNLFWLYAVLAVITLALSFWRLSKNRQASSFENQQKGESSSISSSSFWGN